MQVRPFKAIDASTLGPARAQLEPLLRQLNGPLQDLSQAATKNLTIGDNLAVSLKTITVTVPTDWVTIPTGGAGGLQNGWTANGGSTPGYRKDASGVVWVRGRIVGGSALVTKIFQLPSAYAPPELQLFAVRAAGVFGSIQVGTDGNVFAIDGSTTDMSLNISFSAADRTPVAASCWPVVLSWDLPGQCIGCEILAAYPLDPSNKGVPLSNVSVFAGLPSWQSASANGKPQVKILNVPGLAPGKSYRLLFALWAG